MRFLTGDASTRTFKKAVAILVAKQASVNPSLARAR
jgi:hypothetical protein